MGQARASPPPPAQGAGGTANLTLVALHVEVLIQSHHSHGLLAARLRHDGSLADRAPGGVLPGGAQKWGRSQNGGTGYPGLSIEVQGRR